MSSERGLWKNMQRKVGIFGRFIRIENRVGEGHPDVCYVTRFPNHSNPITGWLELKEEVWPKRQDTPLHIKSLKKEQVLWHEDWEQMGGRVATLALVGQDYLFLNTAYLRQIYERQLTENDLRHYSNCVIGHGSFPTGDFMRRLTA